MTLVSVNQSTLKVSDLVANPSRTAARRSLKVVKKNTRVPRAGEKILSTPSVKRTYTSSHSRINVTSSNRNATSYAFGLWRRK